MFEKTKINEKEAGDSPLKKLILLLYNCHKITARFCCLNLGTNWVGISKFAPSKDDYDLVLRTRFKYVHLKSSRAPQITHQNLAIILRQLYYGKISFIVLIFENWAEGWFPKNVFCKLIAVILAKILARLTIIQ